MALAEVLLSRANLKGDLVGGAGIMATVSWFSRACGRLFSWSEAKTEIYKGLYIEANE